jgi:hypothetical protein
MKVLTTTLLIVLLSSGIGAQSPSKNIADAQESFQSAPSWVARGGEVTVSFNRDLLKELRIELVADGIADRYESSSFPLPVSDAEALTFLAPQGGLERLSGGALRSNGRFEWNFAGQSKSFKNFTVRPKAGTPRDLEFLDAEGVAWFNSDHVHFELLDDKSRLRMRNMDLRLTRAAAMWLGDVSLTGLAVGSMDFSANIVQRAPIAVPQSCASPNWPGKPLDPLNPAAGTYQADVLLSFMTSLDYKRCAGSCDGPGGVADGSAVFAPNATLNNSDTNTTADVAWYAKFSGNFAPYSNDQHPFLTWNIYRISTDGQIEHIGRSGVKHAFLTLNTNCATYNCGDSHILWRQCGDVYSSGNNDSTTALGPRSEIVPAKGIWARCGSVYDVNCDGTMDTTSLTSIDNRLLVPESSISNTTDYSYFYEGWYIVRDDVNIYNTMGSKQFTPNFSGGLWRSNNELAFVSGPVIDRWVSPTSPGAGNMSTEVVLPPGRLKVAVRTKLLPNGKTRYDYAVMNLDFVNASLDVGANAANVRMLSRAGIDSFSAPSNGAVITNAFSTDGSTAIPDWTLSNAQSVSFSAGSQAAELGWSSLYSFSFEANATPTAGQIKLTSPGYGSDILVASLVPSGNADVMFKDGFE